MKNLTYGCSVVDSVTLGEYQYFLYSRIDNYHVILKQKIDYTEYRYRVLAPDENIASVWANAVSQNYVRPSELSSQIKQYIINSMSNFITSNKRSASRW